MYRIPKAPLLVIAIAMLSISLIVVYNRYSTTAQYKADQEWNTLPSVRPLSSNDHILGNPDAAIEVIVFSDPECPYCKDFHQQVMPRILQKYGNDIVLIYRHFLLARYDQSPKEAQAMECAALLGGNQSFWEFTDALYEATPSHNRLDHSLLVQFAKSARIEPEAFDACMESGETNARVEKDRTEAAVAGVTISPSIVVRTKNEAVLLPGSWYGPIDGAISVLLRKSAQ